MAHVSRVLKELTERNVVICLTPNVLKGKVFSLTDEGKSVAKIIVEDRKDMKTKSK